MFENYNGIINFIKSLKELKNEDFIKITESIVDIERKQQRHKGLGFFHTPERLAKDLQNELILEKGDIIFDPTCGHGMLLKGLVDRGIKVRGIELTEVLSSISKEFLEKEYGYDNAYISQGNTLNFEWEKVEDYNIIISNPPFGKLVQGVEEQIFEKILKGLETGRIKQVLIILPPNFFERNKNRKTFILKIEKLGYSITQSQVYSEVFDNTKINVVYFNITKNDLSNYTFKPSLNKPLNNNINNKIPYIQINKRNDGKFIISLELIDKIINNQNLTKKEKFELNNILGNIDKIDINDILIPNIKLNNNDEAYNDIYCYKFDIWNPYYPEFSNLLGKISKISSEYLKEGDYERLFYPGKLSFNLFNVFDDIFNGKNFKDIIKDNDYVVLEKIFCEKLYKKGVLEKIEKEFNKGNNLVKYDIIYGLLYYEDNFKFFKHIYSQTIGTEYPENEIRKVIKDNNQRFSFFTLMNKDLDYKIKDLDLFIFLYKKTQDELNSNLLIEKDLELYKDKFSKDIDLNQLLSFLEKDLQTGFKIVFDIIFTFINNLDSNKKLTIYSFIYKNYNTFLLEKVKDKEKNFFGNYSFSNKILESYYKKEEWISTYQLNTIIKTLVKDKIIKYKDIDFSKLFKYIINKDVNVLKNIKTIEGNGLSFINEKEFVYILNKINGINLDEGSNSENDDILNQHLVLNNKHLKELKPYQIDGYRKAIEGIEKYNGFIISDDVGLGKTLVGCGVIGDYIEKTNKKILLIAPKSVVGGNAWIKTLEFIGFSKDIISERVIIVNNSIEGFENYIDDNNIGLVVIDEAHKFRNDGNKQYSLLQKFQDYSIEKDYDGNPKIKWIKKTPILMLTATPINNSILDLVNLINLFCPEVKFGVNDSKIKEDTYFWKTLTQYVSKYDRKKIVKVFGNIEVNGAIIKDEVPDINYTQIFETDSYKNTFKNFINDTFKYGINETLLNGLSFSKSDLDNVGISKFTDLKNFDINLYKELPLQKFFLNGDLSGWNVEGDTYSYKDGYKCSEGIFIEYTGIRVNNSSKITNYSDILDMMYELLNEKGNSTIKQNNFLLYLYIKKKDIESYDIKTKIFNIDKKINELFKKFTNIFEKDAEDYIEERLLKSGMELNISCFSHSKIKLDKDFWRKKINNFINKNKENIILKLKENISEDNYHNIYYNSYLTYILNNDNFDILELDKIKSMQYFLYLFEKNILKELYKDKGLFWKKEGYGRENYTKGELKDYISDKFGDLVNELKEELKGLDILLTSVKKESKEGGIFSGFIGNMVLKRLDSSPYSLVKTLDKMYETGKLMPDEDDDEEKKYSTGTKALTKEQRVKIGEINNKYRDFFLNVDNDLKIFELKKVILNEIDKQWLIFTAYGDTLDYLYNNLIKSFPKLNIEFLTGQSSLKERLNKINRFSPEVNGYKIQKDDKKIDILIATDSLSEGVNLHDVYRCINYDLPYNPVRLQQRVGRLFRVGAKHTPVFYNFVPSTLMEELVGIMNIISNKETIIKTFFGDVNFDSENQNDISNFINEKLKFGEEGKADYIKLMEEERKMDIFIDSDNGKNNINKNIFSEFVDKFGYEKIDNIQDKKFYIFSEFIDNKKGIEKSFIIPIYHGQILKNISLGFLGEKEELLLFSDDNFYNLLNTTIFSYIKENNISNNKLEDKDLILEIENILNKELINTGFYSNLNPKKAGNNLDKYALIKKTIFPLLNDRKDINYLVILI